MLDQGGWEGDGVGEDEGNLRDGGGLMGYGRGEWDGAVEWGGDGGVE